MLLQAALNGTLTKEDHPALPVTAEELARDAVACVAAGARAIHMHPRDGDGRETLEAEWVDAAVTAVRDACGAPVGVTTGSWIEADPERKLALVRGWEAADYASVNMAEDGAAQVMEALLERGIDIEAGVWIADDAERLAASGYAGRVLRVLVEPVFASPDNWREVVGELHAALDAHGVTAPRLQHGIGAVTWPLLEDAVRRGLDTRIGLEDTRENPDGAQTAGNEELVRAARAGFGAGAD